ncbi:META domain-containing protein [Streptomyces sp. CAU 1734]|uniref:META domain-containing protein n=1 Tax=Streptomyces sp. CAU 1734 TaxID=3140360 RepID=UPI003260B12C
MRNQLSIPLTVLTLLALAACGSETTSGATSGTDGGNAGDTAVTDLPVTGVEWTVASVTVGGKKRAAPPAAHLQLTGKGRVQGSFGCNRFGAPAEVAGDIITVGASEMTEIGCAKGTQDFENTLRDAFTGKLKAELEKKNLTLTNPAGDTIALVAAEPAPLIGTVWAVDATLTGDVSKPTPANTEGRARLTFGKNGTASGSLGCNRFSAKAKISGSAITLTDMAMTRMMCDTGGSGEVMELEKRLAEVLAKPVTYRLVNRGLTITGEDHRGFHATAAAPAGTGPAAAPDAG